LLFSVCCVSLSRYIVYEFSCATLLLLKLRSSVSICGKVLARCVRGNAIVHGFSMNPDVGRQKIFSPSTHSLLLIRAIDGEDVAAGDWTLMLRQDERQRVEASVTEYPVILLLQRLVCPAYVFVTNSDEFRMLSHSQLSGSYLQSADVTVISADAGVAAIREPEAFSCVANEFVRHAQEGLFGLYYP